MLLQMHNLSIPQFVCVQSSSSPSSHPSCKHHPPKDECKTSFNPNHGACQYASLMLHLFIRLSLPPSLPSSSHLMTGHRPSPCSIPLVPCAPSKSSEPSKPSKSLVSAAGSRLQHPAVQQSRVGRRSSQNHHPSTSGEAHSCRCVTHDAATPTCACDSHPHSFQNPASIAHPSIGSY